MSAPSRALLGDEIAAALARFDATAVQHATVSFIEAVNDLDAVDTDAVDWRVLDALRKDRRFDLLERVAEALLQTGADLPAVRRHYAQVLIERGAVIAGLAAATKLHLDSSDPAEVAEASGLMGRANKQLFLISGPHAGARRVSYLNDAVNAYLAVYDKSPDQVWHGINAAALLLRAARDGIAVRATSDPRATGLQIAAEILERIGTGGAADHPWAWAIAVEAHVARDDLDAALRVLKDKERTVELGPFELASLRRQLTQVWQLSHDGAAGSVLLPPLEALLLQKQGAVLTLDAATGSDGATRDHGFEKLFGAEGAQTQAWFEKLLLRCRGVARIEDGFEEPWGTGFVVDGSALHPALPAKVLVTNAHVIPNAVSAEEAYVTFRGLRTESGTARVPVGRQLWTSPPDQLDVTLVELTELPAGVELSPIARTLPPLTSSPPARVYVIGHPLGATAVKVSVHNNELLDYDDVKVHYLAPTEPGSSGSPVFDKQWSVVALHHSGSDRMPRLHGGGVYPANEGISIQRIRAALGASLPA